MIFFELAIIFSFFQLVIYLVLDKIVSNPFMQHLITFLICLLCLILGENINYERTLECIQLLPVKQLLKSARENFVKKLKKLMKWTR